MVREGQEKGKGKPQVCGCCPLALSKQPVALRTQSQHSCSASVAAAGQALLPSCGEQDGGTAAGTQGSSVALGRAGGHLPRMALGQGHPVSPWPAPGL